MNHLKSFFLTTLFILMAAYMLSCTESDNTKAPSAPEPAEPAIQKIVLEGDDVTLALVNGSAVTRYELELAIRTALGNQASNRIDDSGRHKILESLVAGRAIALVQEADMSPEELAALDKEVQAFREQLLVKQYLAKHAAPQPISGEMIREYYEVHPEKFGMHNIRSYEMIAGGQKLRSDARDELVALLGHASEKKDWQAWAESIRKRGYPVSFRQGQVMENILHPRLTQLMKDLKAGETSNLIFIKETPYVVRIVEDKQVSPQPLNRVEDQIRKALVPVQLKKAVKQASEQVLAKSEVIYKGK